MLRRSVCRRHYYNRDGTRKHGLRNKLNSSLLSDIVHDLSWIRPSSGIGRENRIEHHRTISHDSFPTTDIRNYAIVRLSNIGAILFCHNSGDWSIRGGDDDDFKFLPSHESEDACLDEEASDGMAGCPGDAH